MGPGHGAVSDLLDPDDRAAWRAERATDAIRQTGSWTRPSSKGRRATADYSAASASFQAGTRDIQQ